MTTEFSQNSVCYEHKGFQKTSVLSGDFKSQTFMSEPTCFSRWSFSVLNFIGVWLNKDFELSLSGIGTAMIFIGCGNLLGTAFGSRLIEKIGIKKSLFTGLGLLILIYLLLPLSPDAFIATGGLMLVMLINGFIFPIFMTLLQSTNVDARSTMSSLGNAAMYAGSSIAGVIGGALITKFPSFFGIAYFTVIMYIISVIIYRKSGLLEKDN